MNLQTPATPKSHCAQLLDEVQDCWSLVYRRYTEQGLINANPFGIHTVPHAVSPHACVIFETVRETVVSTMTLMADQTDKLPLDSVYADELDALRQQGRAMVEVGLLADRRRSIGRTARALFDMMRWAAYFTLYFGRSDVVIGVHPHHVGFYSRCFGFQVFAEPTVYPLVNDKPVVPLRLPLREAIAEPGLPPGLKHVRDNPVPEAGYAQRFGFKPEQLEGSLIEQFLQRN